MTPPVSGALVRPRARPAAIDRPSTPLAQLPVEALERAALGGLLATNRWLQPEMIGASA